MAYIGNSLTSQGFIPAVDYFNGNNSTVAFTLSRNVTTSAQVEVIVNNVMQNPSSAFTVLNNTITFTSAPPIGSNNIWVRYVSLNTSSMTPSSGTVGTAQLGSIESINSASSLNLKTEGISVVTLDASQNVGVGCTPTQKLQVAGNVAIQGSTSGLVTIQAPAVAGASVLTLPAQTGTVNVSDSILSLSASVASNNLTVTLNPTTLTFRNVDPTSGIPVSINIASPLTIQVPNTATLGCSALTAQNTVDELVLVVLYNGGTPALGIVNIAGGTNLDETTLISTTAINTSSTSASVVYSTSTITSSPYRVAGYLKITSQTVAGTWANAPFKVQGMGGMAMSMSSLGYGQTWQNVTGSRASGTTYYNTTGKPILISIYSGSGSPYSSIVIVVNGITVATQVSNSSTGNSQSGACTIVPSGASYSAVVLGTGAGVSIGAWNELR
jgi:hypothetical protein